MKLRTTTIILLLLTGLFALPAQEANAQFTGKIKRIRIKKKRVGSGFRIVGKINTNSGTTAAYTLNKIEPADKESPKPTMSSFTQVVNAGDKGGNVEITTDMTCEKECLFSKDVDPVGKKYKLTSTLYNKEDKAISKTKVQEVIIELDDSDCKLKYAFHHASISGLDFYASYSEENNTDYPMLIRRKDSKTNTVTIPVTFKTEPVRFHATISITYTSATDQTTLRTVTSPGVFNAKTNELTYEWPDVDSAIVRCFTISSTICGLTYKDYELNFNRVESVVNGSISFKLKKWNKNSNKDGHFCKDSIMVLEDGLKLETKISGSFQIFTVTGAKLTIGGKAVTDAEVEAILHLKDCKGGTQSIAVTLKYNEKTGEYSNSKALSLCGNTGMTFISGDLKASVTKRQERIRASYKQRMQSAEI